MRYEIISLLLTIFNESAKRVRVVFALLLMVILLQFHSLQAQSLPDSLHRPLKIGVALSGGGAKGIAEIGVLKVMKEAGIKIDYITGTSMGSIIGGLTAIGYSPEYLEDIAVNTNWTDVFTEKPGRRNLAIHEKMLNGKFILTLPINKEGIHLPEGLIAGQNIYMMLSRLTWPVHDINDFSNYPIPFACAATNLENGDLVILDHGYLPDAMRASMAIPSLFTPYKLNGKYLVDGGFSRNLPVQEVKNMGANYVISVDVSAPLKSADSLDTMTSIINQAVSFRIIQATEEQREKSDIVITPDVKEYAINDFDKANELIARGEAAAREQLPMFKKLAKLQAKQPATDGTTISHNFAPVEIHDIKVEGLHELPREFVVTELNLKKGMLITPAILDESIQRLYSTLFFDLVTYRLEDEPNGTRLVIRVIEKNKNKFRLGFRYDSETQASLLLHASFRDLVHDGSLLRFNTRLGDITNISGDYIYFDGVKPRFGMRALLDYTRTNLSWFDHSERIASLVTHDFRTELMGGTIFSNSLLLAAGIRKEFIYFSKELNPNVLPLTEDNFHGLTGLLWLDTYDRAAFPTKGQSILISTLFSGDYILSPINFTTQKFYWNLALPLNHKITFSPTLYLGRTTGREIPAPYWFYVNDIDPWVGYIPFMGYERREIAGRNLHLASLNLQYEFAYHKFLTLTASVGNGLDHWNLNVSNNSYRTGLGISLGALTILGPLEINMSTSKAHHFLLEFQFGYQF